MANVYKDFEEFKSKFKDLAKDELETLNLLFHDFYLSLEYENCLKQEIEKIQTEKIVCPICGSELVVKAGFDRYGDQRYICKNRDCKRKTFTLKCNTLTYYSKCTKQQWLMFFECLFHRETIHVTMDKVGISENTVLAWRHKAMYLIYKMLNHEKLDGLVEIDETYFNVQIKGKSLEIEENPTPKSKKRGISNDKIGVACAIDEKNNILMKVINCGRATSSSLIDTYKGLINDENKVVSDSLRSYHQLQEELGYEWIKIPSGKSSFEGYDLERINSLHGNMKMFINQMRGVSVTFLQGYLSLLELLHRYPRYYQRKSFRTIVLQLFTTPMPYRGYDFDDDFCYD